MSTDLFDKRLNQTRQPDPVATDRIVTLIMLKLDKVKPLGYCKWMYVFPDQRFCDPDQELFKKKYTPEKI